MPPGPQLDLVGVVPARHRCVVPPRHQQLGGDVRLARLLDGGAVERPGDLDPAGPATGRQRRNLLVQDHRVTTDHVNTRIAWVGAVAGRVQIYGVHAVLG